MGLCTALYELFDIELNDNRRFPMAKVVTNKGRILRNIKKCVELQDRIGELTPIINSAWELIKNGNTRSTYESYGYDGLLGANNLPSQSDLAELIITLRAHNILKTETAQGEEVLQSTMLIEEEEEIPMEQVEWTCSKIDYQVIESPSWSDNLDTNEPIWKDNAGCTIEQQDWSTPIETRPDSGWGTSSEAASSVPSSASRLNISFKDQIPKGWNLHDDTSSWNTSRNIIRITDHDTRREGLKFRVLWDNSIGGEPTLTQGDLIYRCYQDELARYISEVSKNKKKWNPLYAKFSFLANLVTQPEQQW